MNFLRGIHRKLSGNNDNNESNSSPQDVLKRKHSTTRKYSSEAPEKKMAVMHYLWEIKRKLSFETENNEFHDPNQECSEDLEPMEFGAEATQERLNGILFLQEISIKYELDLYDKENPKPPEKLKGLLVLGVQGCSKELPSLDIMGVPGPMKPDLSRLPKGFKLGNLAEYKFAGLVLGEVFDRFEIQIYCNLFEQFSYYPYYQHNTRTWWTAHAITMEHINQYRVSPYDRLCNALLNPNIDEETKPLRKFGVRATN